MVDFIKIPMVAIESIILTLFKDIDFVKEEIKRRK